MNAARLTARFAIGATVLLGLAASACTYTGNADDPVTRRFTYMSYLAADDIRHNCGPNSPDRYRFVYNAEYNRQVRLYEVGIAPDGREGKLETRVFGGVPFDPFEFGFDNCLTERAADRMRLRPREVRMIEDALDDAGFYERPQRPIELWSDRYYWLVSGCVEGVFYQNGYPYPSRRYDRQHFADVLEELDSTGVRFVDPPPYEDNRPEPVRRRPHTAQHSGEAGTFVYVVEP